MRLLVTSLLLSTLWILTLGHLPREKMFFLQRDSGEDNDTLLVVTWTDEGDELATGCEVFSDQELIREVLKSSDDKPIKKTSEEEILNHLEECTEITLRRRRRQSGEYSDSRGPPSRYGNSGDRSDRDGSSSRRPNREGNFRDIPSRDMNNRDGSNRDKPSRNDNSRDWSDRRGNSEESNTDSRYKPNSDSSRNVNNRGDGSRDSVERQGRRISSNGGKDQMTPMSNSNERRASGDNRDDEKANSERPNRERDTFSSSRNDIRDDSETTTLSNEMEAPSTESSTQWPIIWPGTKWCGSGDIAKNYDDLGLHEDTDRCCRAHDLCNETLIAGQTKHNLTNNSPFTKLSCQCDDDFHNCLDRVNSVISNTIGNLYFNILKRECYEKNYPLTKKCKKYKTFLKITCKEYERDRNSPKVYQWTSAKRYKKIPFPGPLTVTLPF